MSILVSMNHPCVAEMTQSLLKCGIDVSGVITGYTQRFSKQIDLNQVQLFDIRDFRHADKVRRMGAQSPVSLSQKLLDEYVDCELEFLGLGDRMKLKPFSVKEKRLLFYAQLKFWLNFFDSHPQIDRVLLQSSPHVGYDVVIFHIAQRKGIEVCYLEPTRLGEFYLFERFNNFKRFETFAPQSDYGTLRKKLASEVGKVSAHLREGRDNCLLGVNDMQPVVARAKEVGLSGLTNKIKQAINLVSISQKRRSLTFTDADGGERSVAYIKLQTLLYASKLRALRKTYASYSEKVDLNQNYVYFAMHLQPERTTSPHLTGIYENQLFAIETLARALPEGWYVYVKENPMVMYSGLLDTRDNLLMCSVGKKLYRDPNEYMRISALDNVRLVDIGMDSEQLIKKSRISSTITGSVGWESLLQGKPALTFGATWYDRCNSIRRVNSVASCREALSELLEKTPSQVESDMQHFLDDLLPIVVELPRFMDLEFSAQERQQLGGHYGEHLAQCLNQHNVSERLVARVC